MKKKTYLFLDSTVYSPKEMTDTFGKEVTIDKKDGDEVWFTFVENGEKGYVVYPHLFTANTKLNQEKVHAYLNTISLAKDYLQRASNIIRSFYPSKLK